MASNVLAAIIKTTGQDVADYLDSRFFKPLGIEKNPHDKFLGGIPDGEFVLKQKILQKTRSVLFTKREMEW